MVFIMRKFAKIAMIFTAACMLAGCGDTKTENQISNSEQAESSQKVEQEEMSSEESGETVQDEEEVKVITVTEEVKPVEVPFTDIKIGDRYETIKEQFGECPETDIKVSMAGGKEYNYDCEYQDKKGTVCYGFDGGDQLVYIRWFCEVADEDELNAIDDKITGEMQSLYGDSSGTKADNVFRWETDGATIMITRVNAEEAKAFYCTFYSTAYVSALQAKD